MFRCTMFIVIVFFTIFGWGNGTVRQVYVSLTSYTESVSGNNRTVSGVPIISLSNSTRLTPWSVFIYEYSQQAPRLLCNEFGMIPRLSTSTSMKTSLPIYRIRCPDATISISDCTFSLYSSWLGSYNEVLRITCQPCYTNQCFDTTSGSCIDKTIITDDKGRCTNCTLGYEKDPIFRERYPCICDEGYFWDKAASACTPCPANTFINNDTAYPPTCRKCSEGTFSNPGSSRCCGQGNKFHSGTCQKCEEHQIGNGTSCEDCPTGYKPVENKCEFNIYYAIVTADIIVSLAIIFSSVMLIRIKTWLQLTA